MNEKRTSSGLDDFWKRVNEELERTPANPEAHRNAFYSEPECDCYEVHYFSLADYRLFAWLSVPKGQGPFPGIIVMPDYDSTVTLTLNTWLHLRAEAVILQVTHRGQRRSDAEFEARYPGLLTEGLESAHTYVMRGIYADALRAVDFLAERPEVASQPIATTSRPLGRGLGGSLALIAAAFRPRVTVVAPDTPMMIGPAALPLVRTYPLDEINDYLRAYPDRRAAVTTTLELYDVLAIAGKVIQPVLLNVGLKDRGQCPPPLGDELARRLRQVDLREYPDGGGDGGGRIHELEKERFFRRYLGLSGSPGLS